MIKDRYLDLMINDRVDKLINEDIMLPFIAGMATTAIISGAWKFYKRYIDEAGRICGDLSGSAKDKCILKVRIRGYERTIFELRRSRAKCGNKEDKKKCEMNHTVAIEKYQQKKKNAEDRLISIGG